MEIEYMEWDSAFLGYPVARAKLKGNRGDIDWSLLGNYRLVYIMTVGTIEHPALFHAGGKVTLSKGIVQGPGTGGHMDIRPFDRDTDSMERLTELALISGMYSRFRLDPGFGPRVYEDLYTEWIYKSVTKEIAKEVFVIREKERICGFVSIDINGTLGRIGLIAVGPGYRGKGHGKLLMDKVEEYVFLNDCTELEVVTQSHNRPAMGLYEKSGFQVKEISNIYHYWNDTFQ